VVEEGKTASVLSSLDCYASDNISEINAAKCPKKNRFTTVYNLNAAVSQIVCTRSFKTVSISAFSAIYICLHILGRKPVATIASSDRKNAGCNSLETSSLNKFPQRKKDFPRRAVTE
jgi:hypothetical protein